MSSVFSLVFLGISLKHLELSAGRHTKSELKIFQKVRIKERIVSRKVSS